MSRMLDLLGNTHSLGPIDVIINLILAAIFSGVISFLYIKYGKSISNRRTFSSSFLLITICTVLIISLIKSSVALSLGLVGALSIVRFRTAIKEPEELTYLFFCITIGLGFGANERLITISSGFIIIAILIARALIRKDKETDSFNLSIKSSKLSIMETTSILKKYSGDINFKRLEKDGSFSDFLVNIQFKNYIELDDCINELSSLDENIKVMFLTNQN